MNLDFCVLAREARCEPTLILCMIQDCLQNVLMLWIGI